MNPLASYYEKLEFENLVNIIKNEFTILRRNENVSIASYDGSSIIINIKKEFFDQNHDGISIYNNNELILGDINLHNLKRYQEEKRIIVDDNKLFIKFTMNEFFGCISLRNLEGDITYDIFIYDAGKLLGDKELLKEFNNLFNKNMFDKACIFLESLITYYPQNLQYFLQRIDFYLAWKFFISKMYRCEKNILGASDLSNFDNYIKDRIESSLVVIRKNFTLLDLNRDKKSILSALSYLSSYSSIYSLIYDNFLDSLFFNDKINIFQHGVSFYVRDTKMLKTIAPIILKFPIWAVNIYIRDMDDGDLLVKDIISRGYIVSQDINHLNTSKILIIDQCYLVMELKGIDFSNTIVIAYGHGVEEKQYKNNFNLFIAASEKQMSGYFNEVTENIRSKLGSIPLSKKGEFTYTGPWHIEGDPASKVSKKELKKFISEKTGRNISIDKPLIVMFYDSFSLLEHHFKTANYLAEHYTVIFKWAPHLPIDCIKYFSPDVTLSSNVIFYENIWSANELRFAADYILCGFLSSTALSSLMLGLPFIPFYTKTLYYTFDVNKPFHSWREHMPMGRNLPPQSAGEKFRASWPYFFDLEYPDKIKSAIDNGDYVNWYHNNFKFYQDELFGKYHLKNTSTLTAEYILRFVSQGTLGKECIGYYLQE